jgi:hypothetical protein
LLLSGGRLAVKLLGLLLAHTLLLSWWLSWSLLGATHCRGDHWLIVLLSNAFALWLLLGARAVLVLREGDLSSCAHLRASTGFSGVHRQVDRLEDFGRWADTVVLSIGTGTLTGSLSDLVHHKRGEVGGGAKLERGGIGSITELLLSANRSHRLATTSRGDKLVSGEALPQQPDAQIFPVSDISGLSHTLHISVRITGGPREGWKLADIPKNRSPVLG